MSVDTDIERISNLVNTVLASHDGVYIVKVNVKPTNNYKIYLDADAGLNIDTCTKVTKRLRKYIDEMEWYPEGDYSLEVSSPGIDEPLLLQRQYAKNINRPLEVTLHSNEVYNGKLIAVDQTQIELEITTGKGKKAETIKQIILLETIKKAIVQIIF
jgi:ribosome maturation factor RimP